MRILSLFRKSNSVYFPGCVTYYKFQDYFELYQKILSKLGIDFRLVDKNLCCGLSALELGYEQEARKLARRNLEIFREQGITNIITNSPECYKMFLQDYPDLLPDWNLEVKNIWKIILDKLEKKPYLIKNKAMEIICFHDSCYLSRYCDIYDEQRKILEYLGYEIKEMKDSKKNSICCGSCGGLMITNPDLADKIAKNRILSVKRMGIKKLVVSSLENYQLLKRNIGDSGVEILDMADVLSIGLGIKKPAQKEEEISNEDQIVIEAKANERINNELNEEILKDVDWEK